ncbi:transporter substrate-binding domain-containing protein [Methylobrevis albus]|uniref:Transporter substrate-binding domain-containing protein n=1 Tax=Methylobrevis albus TaxID=2793297 RepID=A0A931I220_9HYPH|nr:transporter substrate-binding domain-containing protein [Methylobrevis albus]MBH0237974.1 transporter substrate-binding domain-containing protein [Methylobrevis albus]
MPADRIARLRAVALSLALVAGLPLAAQAETLKLGNEGVYPPFSMVDAAGNLTGVEPDLAREMCKRMAVECEFVVMDFKALIPSMLQGKFDVLVSQVTPTPERKEKMLFGTRIVANPNVFIMPADADYPFTREGVAGKGLKIATQRGGAGIKLLQERFGDSVEIVLYDNPDQFHLDMLAGRVHASFEAKINSSVDFLTKAGGEKFKMGTEDFWLGEDSVPEAERGLSWVVRKDSPELLARMDVALKEIIADCTYTAIRKKYLEIEALPEEAACADKTN